MRSDEIEVLSLANLEQEFGLYRRGNLARSEEVTLNGS